MDLRGPSLDSILIPSETGEVQPHTQSWEVPADGLDGEAQGTVSASSSSHRLMVACQEEVGQERTDELGAAGTSSLFLHWLPQEFAVRAQASHRSPMSLTQLLHLQDGGGQSWPAALGSPQPACRTHGTGGRSDPFEPLRGFSWRWELLFSQILLTCMLPDFTRA